MNLRREPALLLGFLAALIQLVSAVIFPLSDEQQGVLNGLLAVVAGVVVAAMVSLEKAVPLLVGLAQAVIAVGLAFGMELDPVAQSAIMGVVVAGVSLFTRTQVVVGTGSPAVEAVRSDH